MLTQSTTLCIDGFSNDDINYNHSLYIYIYILVYSPFSDSVGLPLHKIPSSGILKKSFGAVFFNDRMPVLASTTCVGCSIK